VRQLHDHPRSLALLRRLKIEPVYTTTEASWLNLVEAHFGAMKRFTLANTVDPSHAVRRRCIYRYLRYRHRKTGIQDHRLAGIRAVRKHTRGAARRIRQSSPSHSRCRPKSGRSGRGTSEQVLPVRHRLKNVLLDPLAVV
jgi:hypothetical protein